MFDFLKKFESKNENLYKDIVQATRSSLDINKTKRTIINVIGKKLNADRCFIMEYDKENDRFEILDEEYLSSESLSSCVGLDLNISLPHVTRELKKGKNLIYNQSETKLDGIKIDLNDGTFELEKKILEEYKIYSGVVFPIVYAGNFLGDIVIHYVDKNHKAGDDEINLINMVSDQLAIALYQAKLYREVKLQNEIQATILNNIPFMAWLKDRNNRYLIVNNKLAESFNMKLEDIIGKLDSDFTPSDLAEKYCKDDLEVMNTKKTKITEELIMYKGERRWAETFKSPIIDDRGKVLGTTGLAHDITDRKANEFELLERQQKIIKANERELLLKKIIEKIRSSLDIDVTTRAIVNEIGHTLNPNICFIVKHDIEKDFFYVDKYSEYRSSDEEESFIGHNSDELKFGWFIEKFRSNVIVTFTNVEEFIVENNLQNTPEESFLREYNIKSAYLNNIYYADNILGYLIILYTKDYVVLDEDSQELMKTLASQVGTAIYQSELYSKTKKQAERENLIINVTEKIRRSLDVNETGSFICEEMVKLYDISRATLIRYGSEKDIYEPIITKEYKKNENIKSVSELGNLKNLRPYWDDLLSAPDNIVIINDINDLKIPKEFREIYQKIGTKSILAIAIKKNNEIWGSFVLSDQEKYREWTKDEIEILKSIANQIYIAINQAEYFEKQKQATERERLLRNITEKIRSSLDIEETLSYICEETAKVFQVERTAITMFPNCQNYEEYVLRKEYKKSTDIMGFKEIKNPPKIASVWGKKLMESDKVYSFDNISSDFPEYLKEEYEAIGIKAIIGTGIRRGEMAWGTLVLAEYEQERTWNDEEKKLLKTISDQVYIAINQAELYEEQKLATERERISRNIIEILRSSIDKTIIKKLFVKNIGKFFNADRVFFSEYNTTEKMYAPVDKDSEYLSNSWEKSFVGYDWSNPDIAEHVQPLLEKREIRISNWSDYIQAHPNMSEGFRSLYDDASVKSSYNFPVLYQDKIIGYFGLEFTQKVCELTEEDIGRIRSICTQAGIAMYHADLYEKAQQCDLSNGVFKSEIIEKITAPTNNILDISILLSQNEFERTVQIQYLNSIVYSCNQLLELTKNV